MIPARAREGRARAYGFLVSVKGGSKGEGAVNNFVEPNVSDDEE